MTEEEKKQILKIIKDGGELFMMAKIDTGFAIVDTYTADNLIMNLAQLMYENNEVEMIVRRAIMVCDSVRMKECKKLKKEFYS